MKSAIEKTVDLTNTTINAWIYQQFDNPVNIAIHRRITAKEILDNFPDS